MGYTKVQQQFGLNPEGYASSPVHARGASLARMVELMQPQAGTELLDIATATGHTAFAFAPHVRRVVGLDITPAMIRLACKRARVAGLTHFLPLVSDAVALPFPRQQFDLVTCRIAAHHFADIDRFLAESVRVLRPGGLLGLVDNVVPGSRLRGKKAEHQRQAGRYLNAFERLRDPSHVGCLSLDGWTDAFRRNGLSVLHEETLSKRIDFDQWSWRMKVPPDTKSRLRALLVQAPAAVAEFLTPEFSGDRITFCLREAILIGQVTS